MTAYRDRPMVCPRCKLELRRTASRDAWRCARCAGVLIGVRELVGMLVEHAPGLVPDDGARGITTLGRRSTASLLTCPTCSDPMEPVFLGGVEVDRCYRDQELWLDPGEPEQILARADAQLREEHEQRSWLGKVLRQMLGQG